MLAGRDWKNSSYRDHPREIVLKSHSTASTIGPRHRTRHNTQEQDTAGGSRFTRTLVTHVRKRKCGWS